MLERCRPRRQPGGALEHVPPVGWILAEHGAPPVIRATTAPAVDLTNRRHFIFCAATIAKMACLHCNSRLTRNPRRTDDGATGNI